MPPDSNPPNPPAARKILLAEQNGESRGVNWGNLSGLGHQIDTVADGFAALQALGKTDYDLVIVDCALPVMDIYELAIAYRRQEPAHRHTWIAAMGDQTGRYTSAAAAGIDCWISKPLTPGAVLEMLAQAVGGPEPAFDPESVAQLRALEGDDGLSIFGELVEVFSRCVPLELTALQEAHARGDGPMVKIAAHGLKGSSAQFGAHAVQRRCLEIERCARAGDLRPVGPLLVLLEEELRHLLCALQNESTRHENSHC